MSSMSRSYYWRKDGKVYGPLGSEDLRTYAASGQLLPTDELSKDGTSWRAAASVGNLFGPTSDAAREFAEEPTEAATQITASTPKAAAKTPLRRKPKAKPQPVAIALVLVVIVAVPAIVVASLYGVHALWLGTQALGFLLTGGVLVMICGGSGTGGNWTFLRLAFAIAALVAGYFGGYWVQLAVVVLLGVPFCFLFNHWMNTRQTFRDSVSTDKGIYYEIQSTVKVGDEAAVAWGKVLLEWILVCLCLGIFSIPGVMSIWSGSKGVVAGTTLPAALTIRTSESRLLAFSPDGKQIVSADRDIIRIWDAKTGKAVARFQMKHAELLVVGFSRSGAEVLAGGRDGRVQRWNIKTGKEAPIADDMERFAVETVGAVQGYALMEDSLQGFGFPPTSVPLLDAHGEIRLVDFDGEAPSLRDADVVADMQPGKACRGFAVGSAGETVRAAVLSPHGNWLYLVVPKVGARSEAIVWDRAKGQRVATLQWEGSEIRSLALSPDVKRLAAAGTGELMIWDLSSLQPGGK
jgi:hypothetical protein